MSTTHPFFEFPTLHYFYAHVDVNALLSFALANLPMVIYFGRPLPVL